MAALMPQGKQQYFTAGGIPLVGGKVYTYAAGTTTPLATYTDAAAGTPNTNPVILDSRGEASIFFSAANYKIVVKDSLDSTIWTQDNLPGDLAGSLAASTGSSLVGHIAAGTGAVATTVQAFFRRFLFASQYGTFAQAVTAAATKRLWIDSAITISTDTTIASGLEVHMMKGGVFNVVTGATLTISSPFSAGLFQVFSCTGTGNVKFGFNTVSEVYPEWWGAVAGTGSVDSTAALQAAVDCTVTTAIDAYLSATTSVAHTVKLAPGNYQYEILTISRPVKIVGSGMWQTFLRANRTNTNNVRITTPLRVEISDLAFSTSVTATAGAYVDVTPTVTPNAFSLIKNVAFHDAYTCIALNAAGFADIDTCYFNACTGVTVVVQNTITPDNGDSCIQNCTFNNGTGVSIKQFSSGGLRILNNKFLGGTYHYLGEYNTEPTRTGILLITGNSFDQASAANIAFTNSIATPFSIIDIVGNHITVPGTGVGVYSVSSAAFLFGLSVGDNIFYLSGSGTGINLGGVYETSIGPNMFRADAAGTTSGIVFGSNNTGIITLYPQAMTNIDTEYTNETYAVVHRTNPVYRTYAGDPNNNITPNFTSEDCLDTTNSKWYKAFGTAGNQWAALN